MTPTLPLAGDMMSRSSSPHLFVDSSSHSDCSGYAAAGSTSSSFDLGLIIRPATPHIFLSYAKPRDKPQQTIDRHSNLNKDKHECRHIDIGGCEHSPLAGMKAYLTHDPKNHLSMANSTDETQRTQARQETSETRQQQIIDWRQLSCDFEGQCRRYMAEQHQLSDDHAHIVAAAMGRAFAEATRQACTKTHYITSKSAHLAKYASMIDRAFVIELSSSTNQPRDNDLMDICREQEVELMFLRAAIKHLVLGKDQDTKAKAPELAAEVPNSNEEMGIPIHIEIQKEISWKDQPNLEDSSELTPSEGDFLETISPPLQPRLLFSNFKNAPAVTPAKTTHTAQYPNLEKGQVKGQHARCLDFFMYMNDLQTLLCGKYSGKISLDTGFPHGKGVFRFENGDFYVGDFLNGMMHGEGCLFTRRQKKLLKLRGTFQHNDFFGDGSLLNDSKNCLSVCV